MFAKRTDKNAEIYTCKMLKKTDEISRNKNVEI